MKIVAIFNNYADIHNQSSLMKKANFEANTITLEIDNILIFDRIYKNMTPSMLWLSEVLLLSTNWINSSGNVFIIFYGPTGNFYTFILNFRVKSLLLTLKLDQ